MKKTIIWLVVIIAAGALIYAISPRAEAPAQAPVVSTSRSTTGQTAGQNAGTLPAGTPAKSTLPPSQTLPAKSITVVIADFAFSPKTITVAPGTTVTWVNRDSMAHTVTSVPGGPVSSQLARGASYSFTFNTPGAWNYHCSIHPGMTGEVIVSAK